MSLQSTSLVLVVVMNNPRDLEIARLLGWYRIPLRSAPKIIDVDYLAFYQTSAFGEAKWRIEYVAAVRGHELTTRAALLREEPDHPHAHHEYYKIQIGPLEKLPHPILADKWRRITFFFTLGEHFCTAQTVSDLIADAGERQLLWRVLRERSNFPQEQYPEGDLDLESEVLAHLLGLSKLLDQSESEQKDEDVGAW